MTKEEILNNIKSLASSQGFYSRLYNKLSDGSEESEEYLEELASLNIKDAVDLVLYFES